MNPGAASVPARDIALIALVALGARLAYLALVYSGDASLMVPDSGLYLALAAESHAWMASAGHAGDWQSDPTRLPLYPLFLAAVRLFVGSPDPLYPVLAQIVIDSLACLMVARLGASFGGRTGLIAGLAAALNPTQIVFSALILTDSLFLFFATAMLAASCRWLERPKPGAALAIGLAGGGALLTRAVLWPWLALLALLLAALLALAGRWRETGWRRFLAQAALGAAAVVLVISPVIERNLRQHGTLSLSAQSGWHALYWIVPLAREAGDGTPWARSVAELEIKFAARTPGLAELGPFALNRAQLAFAAAELAALGPVAIAGAWAYGAAINLAAPAVIQSPPVAALPRTGFYATPGDSKLDKIVTFMFRNDHPVYARILLAGIVLEVLLRLGQGLGLARAWGRREGRGREGRARLALLLAWIGFVLAVSGPVASAKYRLPAEPALAVLLALGLGRMGGVGRMDPRT